jgi:hypothetical protein
VGLHDLYVGVVQGAPAVVPNTFSAPMTSRPLLVLYLKQFQ